MPKDSTRRSIKYYAVRKGRGAPVVHSTWEEAKAAVSQFPRPSMMRFFTRAEADDWIRTAPSTSNDCISGAPASKVPTDNIMLSDEQQFVLDMVKQKRNVFFTGSAGTGKSTLLKEIIGWCTKEAKGNTTKFAVTASTGIAGVNIGGSTLHSWAGIGLGKEPVKQLLDVMWRQYWIMKDKEKERRRRLGIPEELADEDNSDEHREEALTVVGRWKLVETLIVDEISMIDGRLFQKLEHIARELRGNDSPFGGIQLVLSGDFCQLPPVPDRFDGLPIRATFAFEAESWNRCVGRPIVLKKVFRQKEQEFVDMLNELRFGNLQPQTIKTFKSLSGPVQYDDGVEPCELFPTRNDVDFANSTRLSQLTAPEYEFVSIDVAGSDDQGNHMSLDRLKLALDRLVSPQSIILKVGAQVMLLKNLQQNLLVNGSMGRVVGFCTMREALQRYIRIGLMDLQRGEEDFLRTMAFKQPQEGDDPIMGLLGSPKEFPIVEFPGFKWVLCVPNQFDVVNAVGRIEASRQQIPLILAWALSIHKSQGQTLDRVRVDLARVFENGQAYVALSRATSIKRLQVLNFDPARVTADERVVEFMGRYYAETEEGPGSASNEHSDSRGSEAS